MKQVITLTTGLPASGKSTWAKRYVQEQQGKVVRVNLDDLRVMLGIDPAAKDAATKELIKVMHSMHDKAILAAIAAGKDVVVDNTHLNATVPKRIKKLFNGEIEFRVEDFTDVPMEACITRDALRANTVGADVIRGMAKMLNKPWRLTAEFMNDYEYDLEPYELKPDAPLCVVFDIDGTLAKHHRSPYDYERLHTDTVHEHIRSLNEMYWNAYRSIFIVSGRPDTYYRETKQWLDDNGIQYDALYMRRGDDKRDDRDVKHEIFNKHFRDQYNVEMWIDDRDRVVKRMRALGVNVMQVADGDF